MVQSGPLRRAHRLRAITLASPTKKARPYAVERGPVAWHTNDENTNAEASEEASARSTVTNTSEPTILPIPALLDTCCTNPLYTRFRGRRLDPRVPLNRTLRRALFPRQRAQATTIAAQMP